MLRAPAGAEDAADFVILGIRKKGAITRALGSTAEPVVRASHVPVLSFPLREENRGLTPLSGLTPIFLLPWLLDLLDPSEYRPGDGLVGAVDREHFRHVALIF